MSFWILGYRRCYGIELFSESERFNVNGIDWGEQSSKEHCVNLAKLILSKFQIPITLLDKYVIEVSKFHHDRFCITEKEIAEWRNNYVKS